MISRLALAVVLPGLLGCGGALKYKIDDKALDMVSADDMQTVVGARQNLELAERDRRAVEDQYTAFGKDRAGANRERDEAKLAVNRLGEDVSRAEQTKDEAAIKAARRSRAIAEFALVVAESKLDQLEKKEDWLKAERNTADHRVLASRAFVELEKARVARQKGLRPDEDFRLDNFDNQWKKCQAEYEIARKSTDESHAEEQAAERNWQQRVEQLKQMQRS